MDLAGLTERVRNLQNMSRFLSGIDGYSKIDAAFIVLNTAVDDATKLNVPLVKDISKKPVDREVWARTTNRWKSLVESLDSISAALCRNDTEFSTDIFDIKLQTSDDAAKTLPLICQICQTAFHDRIQMVRESAMNLIIQFLHSFSFQHHNDESMLNIGLFRSCGHISLLIQSLISQFSSSSTSSSSSSSKLSSGASRYKRHMDQLKHCLILFHRVVPHTVMTNLKDNIFSDDLVTAAANDNDAPNASTPSSSSSSLLHALDLLSLVLCLNVATWLIRQALIRLDGHLKLSNQHHNVTALLSLLSSVSLIPSIETCRGLISTLPTFLLQHKSDKIRRLSLAVNALLSFTSQLAVSDLSNFDDFDDNDVMSVNFYSSKAKQVNDVLENEILLICRDETSQPIDLVVISKRLISPIMRTVIDMYGGLLSSSFHREETITASMEFGLKVMAQSYYMELFQLVDQTSDKDNQLLLAAGIDNDDDGCKTALNAVPLPLDLPESKISSSSSSSSSLRRSEIKVTDSIDELPFMPRFKKPGLSLRKSKMMEAAKQQEDSSSLVRSNSTSPSRQRAPAGLSGPPSPNRVGSSNAPLSPPSLSLPSASNPLSISLASFLTPSFESLFSRTTAISDVIHELNMMGERITSGIYGNDHKTGMNRGRVQPVLFGRNLHAAAITGLSVIKSDGFASDISSPIQRSLLSSHDGLTIAGLQLAEVCVIATRKNFSPYLTQLIQQAIMLFRRNSPVLQSALTSLLISIIRLGLKSPAAMIKFISQQVMLSNHPRQRISALGFLSNVVDLWKFGSQQPDVESPSKTRIAMDDNDTADNSGYRLDINSLRPFWDFALDCISTGAADGVRRDAALCVANILDSIQEVGADETNSFARHLNGPQASTYEKSSKELLVREILDKVELSKIGRILFVILYPPNNSGNASSASYSNSIRSLKSLCEVSLIRMFIWQDGDAVESEGNDAAVATSLNTKSAVPPAPVDSVDAINVVRLLDTVVMMNEGSFSSQDMDPYARATGGSFCGLLLLSCLYYIKLHRNMVQQLLCSSNVDDSGVFVVNSQTSSLLSSFNLSLDRVSIKQVKEQISKGLQESLSLVDTNHDKTDLTDSPDAKLSSPHSNAQTLSSLINSLAFYDSFPLTIRQKVDSALYCHWRSLCRFSNNLNNSETNENGAKGKMQPKSLSCYSISSFTAIAILVKSVLQNSGHHEQKSNSDDLSQMSNSVSCISSSDMMRNMIDLLRFILIWAWPALCDSYNANSLDIDAIVQEEVDEKKGQLLQKRIKGFVGRLTCFMAVTWQEWIENHNVGEDLFEDEEDVEEAKRYVEEGLRDVEQKFPMCLLWINGSLVQTMLQPSKMIE